MGFYVDRENYFKELASTHVSVKHNQSDTVEENLSRRSFFRINDEEELMAASQHWIHFPCVVMVGLVGGMVDRSTNIRQGNLNTLMFLQKMQLEASEPVIAAAITVSYEKTFEIMQDFIAKIRFDYDEEDGCGVFKGIDEGSFKWEQVGPIGEEMYGWVLTFRDETKTKKYSADRWQINNPETVFILADENGNAILTEDGNTIKI